VCFENRERLNGTQWPARRTVRNTEKEDANHNMSETWWSH